MGPGVHEGVDVGQEQVVVEVQLVGEELVGAAAAAREEVVEEQDGGLRKGARTMTMASWVSRRSKVKGR